jgi:hypothetical protein
MESVITGAENPADEDEADEIIAQPIGRGAAVTASA